jgi:hypothetical protein
MLSISKKIGGYPRLGDLYFKFNMKKMKKTRGGGRKQEMSGKDEETGQEHRVGRVLSFFSSRRNWDSPTPSPANR